MMSILTNFSWPQDPPRATLTVFPPSAHSSAHDRAEKHRDTTAVKSEDLKIWKEFNKAEKFVRSWAAGLFFRAAVAYLSREQVVWTQRPNHPLKLRRS